MTQPTESPRRVQLRRTKGWRMPPNTVKVDRSTRWGNPFHVGDPVCMDGISVDYHLTAEQAVWEFRIWVTGGQSLPVYRRRPLTTDEIRRGLRGKNLACWCAPGKPCHADVLLEIANG